MLFFSSSFNVTYSRKERKRDKREGEREEREGERERERAPKQLQLRERASHECVCCIPSYHSIILIVEREVLALERYYYLKL
jgi:hypothetical protein